MGIFDFWQKTPQNYKRCLKNGQNYQFALLSLKFHQKNPLFDIDLFSRTFDMESPSSGMISSVITGCAACKNVEQNRSVERAARCRKQDAADKTADIQDGQEDTFQAQIQGDMGNKTLSCTCTGTIVSKHFSYYGHCDL